MRLGKKERGRRKVDYLVFRLAAGIERERGGEKREAIPSNISAKEPGTQPFSS